MGIDWNKWLKGLTLVSAMCVGGTVLADDIVVTDGLWKVTYMESEKAFRPFELYIYFSAAGAFSSSCFIGKISFL